MKIAVTGATGFVGQALCPYLESQLRADIIKLTREPTHSGHQTLALTMSDHDIIAALEGIDCLIHLAARAHNHKSTELDFKRDNVELTARIATLCASAKIPRVIYLSSIKVNGNSTNGRTPYTADELSQPDDEYGRSKLECERILMECFSGTETKLTVIRPPLVYGKNNKGNLQTLETLIAKKIPLPFGGLNNRRDLISLSNLCNLISLCVTHPKAINETFLASDDKARSTKEIIELLAARKGIPTRFFKVPTWAFSFLNVLAPQTIERLTGDLQVDIKKTKSLLDWNPNSL